MSDILFGVGGGLLALLIWENRCFFIGHKYLLTHYRKEKDTSGIDLYVARQWGCLRCRNGGGLRYEYPKKEPKE